MFSWVQLDGVGNDETNIEPGVGEGSEGVRRVEGDGERQAGERPRGGGWGDSSGHLGNVGIYGQFVA